MNKSIFMEVDLDLRFLEKFVLDVDGVKLKYILYCEYIAFMCKSCFKTNHLAIFSPKHVYEAIPTNRSTKKGKNKCKTTCWTYIGTHHHIIGLDNFVGKSG